MDLIIGAGVSGISYANFTSNDYLILEREAEIGGYCRTIKQDGFVWDYSGHFFHFRHPELEELVCRHIDPRILRRVEKHTQILYKGRHIDFPFQKNIHQLDKEEFIDCLYDLFATEPDAHPGSFKGMIYNNLGKSIAEKFLVPYNQKLYACDLDTLDPDAMGRFFPKASREEIILNFRKTQNQSYNQYFTYPTGGAIEYIHSLYRNLDPRKVKIREQVHKIDIRKKQAYTQNSVIPYDNLISTSPLPQLLTNCGIEYNHEAFTCNKVITFNLGFDKKGTDSMNSWIYVPAPETLFYRIGYYDNIIGSDRMSLYIEIGLKQDAPIEPEEKYLARILKDLADIGIVTDQKLISYSFVVMDPAYVHINQAGIAETERTKALLARHDIYSIGRYGSWTYCSIEDNILEAKALAKQLSAK